MYAAHIFAMAYSPGFYFLRKSFQWRVFLLNWIESFLFSNKKKEPRNFSILIKKENTGV